MFSGQVPRYSRPCGHFCIVDEDCQKTNNNSPCQFCHLAENIDGETSGRCIPSPSSDRVQDTNRPTQPEKASKDDDDTNRPVQPIKKNKGGINRPVQPLKYTVEVDPNGGDGRWDV